jgi:hypothetical protein
VTLAYVLLIAFPFAVALFLAFVAGRGDAPNLYHCQKCGADFRRPPHERYPGACPACHATDWANPTA